MERSGSSARHVVHHPLNSEDANELNLAPPAPPITALPYYGFAAPVRRNGGGESAPRCEDAEPILEQLPDGRVFACVADGLGGYSLGYAGRSGGYIASRTVAAGAAEFFRNHPHPDAGGLTRHLFDKLRTIAAQNLPESRIKGTLLRHRLASTLACMVIDARGGTGEAAAELFWIGDSRIYFLDETGLKLLTRDDCLVETDAFDAVFEDSPMSKFLAASMDETWCINSRKLPLPGPGVMIACTDGCTAYWKRPWEFELALAEAFKLSGDWEAWLVQVKHILDTIRSDDASLIAYPVGIDAFQTYRKQFLHHHRHSAGVTAAKAAGRGRISERSAWLQIYKPHYQQWLPPPAERPKPAPRPQPASRRKTAGTPPKTLWQRLWPFK